MTKTYINMSVLKLNYKGDEHFHWEYEYPRRLISIGIWSCVCWICTASIFSTGHSLSQPLIPREESSVGITGFWESPVSWPLVLGTCFSCPGRPYVSLSESINKMKWKNSDGQRRTVRPTPWLQIEKGSSDFSSSVFPFCFNFIYLFIFTWHPPSNPWRDPQVP